LRSREELENELIRKVRTIRSKNIRNLLWVWINNLASTGSIIWHQLSAIYAESDSDRATGGIEPKALRFE